MTNPTPEFLMVLDTNATDPDRPRVHTIIVDGLPKDIEFARAKSVKLPFSQAVKFLKAEGFIVSDDAGTVYKPTAEGKTTDGSKLVLNPDQCIASYDELTMDALAIRANQRPGGERFKKNSKRPEVIAFLSQGGAEAVKASTNAKGAPSPAGADEDVSTDDASEDETNAIFGDDA